MTRDIKSTEIEEKNTLKDQDLTGGVMRTESKTSRNCLPDKYKKRNLCRKTDRKQEQRERQPIKKQLEPQGDLGLALWPSIMACSQHHDVTVSLSRRYRPLVWLAAAI